ncbi:MAG: hypothetical protein ACPGN3_12775 [Opitutales bacterium]
MRIIHTLTFVFLFFFNGGLSAQEIIEKQVRAVSLGASIESLALLSDTGAVDISVPKGRRSDAYLYAGSSNLKLIKQGTYIPDGPLPPVVAQAYIPECYKRPLLIFTEDNGNNAIIVIEDDMSRFSGNGVLFANMTPYRVALVFGDDLDERISLESVEMKVHEFDESSVNVRVRAATQVGGELFRALDTRLFPNPQTRDIYFIYSNPRKGEGAVSIRTLRENILTAQLVYRDPGVPNAE